MSAHLERVAEAIWAADGKDPRRFPFGDLADFYGYRKKAQAAIDALGLGDLPLGTVRRGSCEECGENIYRHANAPWLHVDTGLRWCYRNPDSAEVATPVGPWERDGGGA